MLYSPRPGSSSLCGPGAWFEEKIMEKRCFLNPRFATPLPRYVWTDLSVC